MTNVLRTVRTKTEAYHIELPCEESGCSGMMESCEGGVLMSNPPQYPHKCTKCGKVRYITGITYPYIEHSR